MEALVVTLETARTLKAAGFPQTRESWKWVDSSANLGPTHLSVSPQPTTKSDSWCSAPTAQEIADQLPRQLKLDSGTGYLTCGPGQGHTVNFWAGYDTPEGPEILELGDTMAEALALLWLKLNEETQQ